MLRNLVVGHPHRNTHTAQVRSDRIFGHAPGPGAFARKHEDVLAGQRLNLP